MGAKPKEENEVIPKSQHLLKTEMPLTSDTLWLECFVIYGDKEPGGNAGVQK